MDEQRRWITVTATGLLRRYDGFSNGKYKSVFVICTLVHSKSYAKLAVGDCILSLNPLFISPLKVQPAFIYLVTYFLI
jgi:hypothetical protein